MLKEIVPTRQIPGEPARRWYMDEEMDLIVWFSGSDELLGFQLSYRVGRDERALTWYEGRGYSYDRVDDGEGRPGRYKMTPVLIADGGWEPDFLLGVFLEKARQLPPGIVEFVRGKILAQPGAIEPV